MGLVVLILSPDPAPPHEDQHNQAQGEEGWGRGGRPAPRKGWVLCKASLLLSAALSQFGSEPGVMVRRPLGRRVLVQLLRFLRSSEGTHRAHCSAGSSQ